MKTLLLILISSLTCFAQNISPPEVSKSYVDNQVEWVKRYTDAEIKSIRDAVGKVEAVNVAKFEGQNEWRQQMKDQTGTYVTRTELWTAVVLIIAASGSIIGILSKAKSK
jgi:hypothetical protein